MPNQQPDTTSFLSRHRTICAVLEELRNLAGTYPFKDDTGVVMDMLIDEAKDYAQRMSNRLMEYKRAEQLRK